MTPLEELRAEYAKLKPYRDPDKMPISATEEALLSLVSRWFEERSIIKKCPPAHAEGYLPQRNVGFGLCEIE